MLPAVAEKKHLPREIVSLSRESRDSSNASMGLQREVWEIGTRSYRLSR